ncbi:MAG: hypothetical protein K0S57_1882 [Ramlibacter sp.]|nr:hypothetical protein [Ramlibacter sp.]
MAHQSTSLPRAGWPLPTMERVREAGWESIASDEGPGILVSPTFWLGGLFSLGLWTALAWALTS